MMKKYYLDYLYAILAVAVTCFIVHKPLFVTSVLDNFSAGVAASELEDIA